MSNNIKMLLVGCGYMGIEYSKVLMEMGIVPKVVGRSIEGAQKFRMNTGIEVMPGGMAEIIEKLEYIPTHAIIATPLTELASCTISAINAGIRKILLEKPAGLNKEEIKEICECATHNRAEVFVAYNRRFYSSTEKALEIIKEDGGVSSFHFEFTEWASRIEKITNPVIEKENWLLANSTHVIDLAFFLGGEPVEMNSYVSGKLLWHPRGAVYAGAGRSDKGALFSYQADWSAPGRWSIEIMTKWHRLYFKPMEELRIQKLDSINVENIELDDSLDKRYKPGLYKQVSAFLFNRSDDRLIDIVSHLKRWELFLEIGNYYNEKE